jgi:hypothetical protein
MLDDLSGWLQDRHKQAGSAAAVERHVRKNEILHEKPHPVQCMDAAVAVFIRRRVVGRMAIKPHVSYTRGPSGGVMPAHAGVRAEGESAARMPDHRLDAEHVVPSSRAS